ncbi:tyrosine-protein phosphatase 99A [Cimex lectularius]|uniref:Protein-tyrosine-phosphatase n=1 Tax=Cimex lectularius TaxID=79782 RepID=A0A8I6SAR7_CIMLE|nr:tyrosine-protein phosphatase 99A [Cimex lectularius]
MTVLITLILFNVFYVSILQVKCDEEVKKDTPYSNKPANLTIGKVTNTTIDLSWSKPEQPSGDILSYHLYYLYGTNYSAVQSVNSSLSRVHYTLKNLKPFTTYTIWVESVVTGDGDSDAEKSDVATQSTDVSGPGPPRITNATCITPNSLYVQWQRPIEFFNKIDAYYVTYRIDNSPDSEEIIIDTTLNEDIDTSQIVSNLTDKTWYEVKVRGASRSVLNLNHYMQGVSSIPRKVFIQYDCDISNESVEETNKVVNVILITGLVCASFALCLIVCVITVWRHWFHAAYYYLEESRQVVTAPAFDWAARNEQNPPIPVDMFAKHVASLHADGDIGFSKEYDSIQFVYLQDQFSSEVSTHPENKMKNRYLNILAYDHSRVRLMGGPGQNRCVDYINANYIDGFEKTNAYIGTQGPLPNTFDCFWRMVWEQGVTVIVMITNLVERGRRKCDLYWPKEGTETYGHIQVRLVKEDVLAMYTVRTMKIVHLKAKRKKYTMGERQVQQFHYTNWHDHGTPDHPLPILSFVNKSSSANNPNSGPIVVHCSAGVGRTGTYIVLDAMLKQIRAREEVNIYGYLKYIRNQRNYLVQTEEQYIFIHDAILEAITFAENALSTECLHYILQPNPETDSEHWKQFQANYKMVTSFEAKEYNHISANKPCNLIKNRSTEFIPLENSRVHLTPKPGIEGSDYINASWFLGFKKLKEFVITQHPLDHTVIDFWQMIWDHNAQTIVLLSAIDGTEGFNPFWPIEKEHTMDSDNFKLKIIEESELDGTVSRDFTIQSLHDDYELTVRIIQPSHTITEISDIIHLINIVQQHHLEYQNGPIVVVDELGGTVAATFCCLTTLMKQLDYDSHADVSIYAKLYHNRIPGIWKTIDDYLMLYRGLSEITVSKGVSLIASPDPYIHNHYSSYTNGTALS